VVLGDAGAYIADDGRGIDPTQPVITLAQAPASGIWQGDAPSSVETFKSRPYMHRITNAEGDTVYRTDIFSRSQAGRGAVDPAHDRRTGSVDTLNGTVSCSVVIDPDAVRRGFESAPPGEMLDLIPAEEFWVTEFTAGTPVSSRLDDLIIPPCPWRCSTRSARPRGAPGASVTRSRCSTGGRSRRSSWRAWGETSAPIDPSFLDWSKLR
jgi:1,4-alpha-glucan branching enzyme